MNFHFILTLLVVLGSATGSWAQAVRPIPEIGYVYPAGGQRGTTLKVTVGGRNLTNASTAFFSPGGMTADVTGYHRLMTQKEFNEVREELKILQERRAKAGGRPPGWTEADEAELRVLKTKNEDRPNREISLALAETVTLEIALPPQMPLGGYELRLKTPGGLSNPLAILVGDLPEFEEPMTSRGYGAVPSSDTMNTMNVTLPLVVNGRILPAEVDRFRFTAVRGQRLVFAVSARALIPFLADTVPGWFQATLALYDAAGHELAYVDDFRFEPDPVLSCEIPADGDYTIEIKDALHRGREDFVYRIAAGELSFVTGIFPLGASAGATTRADLTGWNLPAEATELKGGDGHAGVSTLMLRGDGTASGAVPFMRSAGKETSEAEPNDAVENAQALGGPTIVNGRLGTAGDRDVFRVEGKAGDTFVAEVMARRLHSPLDSVLVLTDAGGQSVAFNDDHEDKSEGLITHQADSYISTLLPADGPFFLTVQDRELRGGSDFSYRLRVGPPEPDFTVLVTPSTLNLRAGTSALVTAQVVRRDGFDGEVKLALRQTLEGFTLSGARVPAGQTKTVFTLNASGRASLGVFDLAFDASARIADQAVTHRAEPADERTQAFLPRHLVPAKTLVMDVTGGSRWRAPAAITAGSTLQIAAGGTADFRVRMPVANGGARIRLELSNPPDGIVLAGEAVGEREIVVRVSCDAEKMKPGLQGNLIFIASAERKPAEGKGKSRTAAWVPLGPLPAVPFEVVPP